MREIKFKAWCLETKRMCTVNSIDFKNDIISVTYPDGHGFSDKIDSVILMQFTGLQDKNDVDIYEGYIVDDGGNQSTHCISGVHEVRFERGAFFPFAEPMWECVMDVKNCEIIGNIYENKNLIK